MNSVLFLDDFEGQRVCLLGAPADYKTATSLTLSLPADVTRGLLAGESRRSFAASNRYTYDFVFETAAAADSNDLRLLLNNLKNEPVAAPLWDDYCELNAACLAGATVLQKTSMMPARFGIDWLLVDDAGDTFEIVQVTAVGATTITLAAPGTQYAWPSGTTIIPLLWGRLADQRPQLTAITDEILSCHLVVQENSDYSKRITPVESTLLSVGSRIPEFTNYLLWNIEPDWSALLDDTEADVLYKQIGYLRQEQEYVTQNWNRRGLEMSFTCGRAQVALIESFFARVAGTTYPFFNPTWRGDLRLAGDLPQPDASQILIEESRYEIGEYDEHPGAGFIAVIDPEDDTGNMVFPFRVTEVAETTLTLEEPVLRSHPAARCNLSFLMLVRFAEAKIEWSYENDGLASAKIKFVEVPAEYVTPVNPIPLSAFLYRFDQVLPNGWTNSWFFTSYEYALTVGGQSYLPAPFSHGRYKATLDLSDDGSLTSWGGNFAGNPLNMYLPYTASAEITLTVSRVQVGDLTQVRQLFVRQIKGLKTKGTDWSADLGLSRKFDRKVPGHLFQTSDNYTQFDPPTQLSSAGFRETGTITFIDGITVQVTGPSDVTDWFSNGWLDTGAGGQQELRNILSSVASGAVQTLTLDRPFTFAIAGQSADLYPGYDQSIDDCDTKFGNRINFGGYAYRPDSNPSITPHNVPQPSGGKK